MEVGRRAVRGSEEDTSRRMMNPNTTLTFKKVEVVYYLATSNGHLQHPHYIQLTLHPNQHLRLKDVLDRLTLLRGKAMPSLYSWSCKRSYKNGYVWNDLALNDVVSPSGGLGGEYVLKGSELPPPSCTEKLHHLQLGNLQQFEHLQESNSFLPKRRHHHYKEENTEEYDDKTTHARCSRGVSTEETKDEILLFKEKQITTATPIELNLHSNRFSSPPSATSSSHSDNTTNDHTIKRFEDGDPIANEPMLSRNSMLFNLIACGGTGSFRKSALQPPCTAARKSGSGSSLHKGVVCKAAKMAAEGEEDDHEMINYMSENPRFGNLQSEDKEYFSGSIVESITDEQRIGALPTSLQKSSSYNQERSKKSGVGELAAEEEEKQGKGVRGKCIPRKKKPTSKHPKITINPIN